MEDYRADPMESPEGHGIARRAWESYVKRTNQLVGPAFEPLVRPAANTISRTVVFDLFGFWLAWHLEGGFEGMQRQGMSRSAIYRRVKLFRSMTGQHPDEFTMPGVTIDLEQYVSESRARKAAKEAREAKAKKD